MFDYSVWKRIFFLPSTSLEIHVSKSGCFQKCKHIKVFVNVIFKWRIIKNYKVVDSVLHLLGLNFSGAKWSCYDWVASINLTNYSPNKPLGLFTRKSQHEGCVGWRKIFLWFAFNISMIHSIISWPLCSQTNIHLASKAISVVQSHSWGHKEVQI